MARALPIFRGFTVDERLRQFRKVPLDGPPEFIAFDSAEGSKLLIAFIMTKRDGVDLWAGEPVRARSPTTSPGRGWDGSGLGLGSLTPLLASFVVAIEHRKDVPPYLRGRRASAWTARRRAHERPGRAPIVTATSPGSPSRRRTRARHEQSLHYFTWRAMWGVASITITKVIWCTAWGQAVAGMGRCSAFTTI